MRSIFLQAALLPLLLPSWTDGSAPAGQQHSPGWAPLVEVAVTQLPAFTRVWVVASLCVTDHPVLPFSDIFGSAPAGYFLLKVAPLELAE